MLSHAWGAWLDALIALGSAEFEILQPGKESRVKPGVFRAETLSRRLMIIRCMFSAILSSGEAVGGEVFELELVKNRNPAIQRPETLETEYKRDTECIP